MSVSKFYHLFLLFIIQSNLFAQSSGVAMSAKSSGGFIGTLTRVLFYLTVCSFIVWLVLKKRKIRLISQAKKKIVGIILAAFGGTGMFIIWLSIKDMPDTYTLNSNIPQPSMTFYPTSLAICIFSFIIGVAMILTSQSTSDNENRSNNSQKSGLDDLEKLSDLRKKGIITDEEFEAKKNKILES